MIATLLPGAAAAQGERGVGAFYDSSLLAWVESVAVALVPRLEGATAVSVEIVAGPGVDERKARRVFQERLRERLSDDGITVVSRSAPVAALSLSLSFSGADAWAVGSLESGGAASALAARFALDRELEALLGVPRAHLGQGRWVLERLGTVPAGVLDLHLMDLDDRDGHEIVLLTVEGVRTLSYDTGAARPTPLGGPWPLGPELHDEHAAGWLGVGSDGLVGGTTAWASSLIDPRTGTVSRLPEAAVLLGQPADPARPGVVELGRSVGPELTRTAELGDAPDVLRDVQLWAGGEGLVWIGADGRLGGRGAQLEPLVLPAGPVGDRLVLGDLDADGRMDLATTAASAPDEPDRLSVHRLDAGAAPLLFQAQVDGGITALAQGDLDFDGAPDLLFVEEPGASEAVLWRLERRR